jgi:aryl-alcohol dehydrogenase-like predicted oxidoreductase
MEYRTLGKTDLKISRLGFGGIPIQKTNAEQTKTLLYHLMEQGVNYIDTARAYTVSEEYIGYELRGIRDRFVLATKSMARTKEAMAKDVKTSLKNLRTDYIDLYQIHNPNAKDLDAVMAEDGALSALLEAKAAGNVRSAVSNITSIGQHLSVQALSDKGYAKEKKAKYAVLRARYREIRRILKKNPSFAESFEAMPFNSGYFMCVKPKGVEAEAVRKRLIEGYSTGTIVLSGLIRLAFSTVPLEKLSSLFASVDSAIRDVKGAKR